MRRLLLVLAVLALLATLSAAAGILLSGRPAGLAGDTLLTWRVEAPIPDYLPYAGLPFFGDDDRQSLVGLYVALSRASEDEHVKGLAVYLQAPRFGLATAQELRRLLGRLRDAGKPVHCYLETAGEGGNGTLAYYLATACGSIWLAPAGELNLLGLYADSPFFRGTLDKLRIEPNYAHVGAYKSASETFTEYEHSPAAEEAVGAILDDFYAQIAGDVAAARGQNADAVRAWIDRAPLTAEEALAAGLVDRLAYPDEFDDAIDELARGAGRLDVAAYRRHVEPHRGRRVAVVFAQGTILRGASGFDPWTDELFIGADDMGRLLGELAEADGVAAVVLRIDSPGGSALASDLILRSVERLARKKPLIVSMSDVAASGGYYIACRAKRILASPATLTGSIGVVGGKLVTRRFQRELLGISHDTLKRGANADLYSDLEAFTPQQAAQVERLMRRVYDTFVGHVSAGRSLTRARVEEIAQGRVWSGSLAHQLGLVDELGGLAEAVEAARHAAGIRPGELVRLDLYPRPIGLLDLVFSDRPSLRLRALAASPWRDALAAVGPWPAPPRRTAGLLQLPPELVGLAQP